jgi:hypothetical protein
LGNSVKKKEIMNLRHEGSTHVEIMIYMFVLFLGMFTDLYQLYKLHSSENISGITHLCYLASQNTAIPPPPEIKSLNVTRLVSFTSKFPVVLTTLKFQGHNG